MRLVEVEQHLRQFLPLELNYFNTWTDVTYSASGTVATITTVADHGLEVGDEVTIKDVVFGNPLTITQSNGTASATSTYQNDLTYPYNETVTISGANESGYNGTHDIVEIYNRREFDFTVDDATASPATGSPVLHEYNIMRYNGLFTVAAVPTTKTFTVTVRDIADFTTTAKISPMADVRIGVDISEERALDSYTKQSTNDFWLFVIPNQTLVSKDKNVATDFVYGVDKGIEIHQQLNEQFNILVFGNSSEKVTPAELLDICRIDVRNALIKCLVGYYPSTELNTEKRGIHYEGDNPYTYHGAYYVHQYAFGMSFDLNMQDTFVPQSAALEYIQVDYTGTHPDTIDTDNPIATDIIDYTQEEPT